MFEDFPSHAWELRQPLEPLQGRFTSLWSGDAGRERPLVLMWCGFGDLERAEHNEDHVAILDGLDSPGCVGLSLADAIDNINDGLGDLGTQEKVALYFGGARMF